MRCSSPFVPGIAHGRESFSSLLYGRNLSPAFFSFRKETFISFRSLALGNIQGSAPLAIYPSERKITGVINSTAILHASKTMWKQSDGVQAATTGMGDSPLRPYIACIKSLCSVLVGRPVDGPPRCTLQMTSG